MKWPIHRPVGDNPGAPGRRPREREAVPGPSARDLRAARRLIRAACEVAVGDTRSLGRKCFTLFTFFAWPCQAVYVYSVHMVTSKRFTPEAGRAGTRFPAVVPRTLGRRARLSSRSPSRGPSPAAPARQRLYRNGPGQFGQGATRYTHPVSRPTGAATRGFRRFAGGKALGCVRGSPRVPALAEERARRQGPLTASPAPWHRRGRETMMRGPSERTTANTKHLMWQGRLLALMEGRRPDPELDRARDSVDPRRDRPSAAIHGLPRSSAHPASRRVAQGDLQTFGLQYGPPHQAPHVRGLPDAGAAATWARSTSRPPPMLHDFIATDTHLIFFRVHRLRVAVGECCSSSARSVQLFRLAARARHGGDLRADRLRAGRAGAVHGRCVSTSGPLRETAFTRGGGAGFVDYVALPKLRIRSTRSAGSPAPRGGGPSGPRTAARTTARRSISRGRTLAARRRSPTPDLRVSRPVAPGRPRAASTPARSRRSTALRAIRARIDANGTIVAHELTGGNQSARAKPLYNRRAILLALCHTPPIARFVAPSTTPGNGSPTGPVAKILARSPRPGSRSRLVRGDAERATRPRPPGRRHGAALEVIVGPSHASPAIELRRPLVGPNERPARAWLEVLRRARVGRRRWRPILAGSAARGHDARPPRRRRRG